MHRPYQECIVSFDSIHTTRKRRDHQNVIHKGLRRLMQDEDASGLPAAVVPKIVRVLSFPQDMEREEELLSVLVGRRTD